MKTEQLPRPKIYNESREDEKRPGAIWEMIMGVYPLALMGVLLLMISILGITNTFQSSVINFRPQEHRTHQPQNAGYISSQTENVASE